VPKVIGTKEYSLKSKSKQHNQKNQKIGQGHNGSNRLDAARPAQQIPTTDNMCTERNEDNNAKIILSPEDDDLVSASYKQDEGWHNALDEDEDEDDEDENNEMENNDKNDDDTSDNEAKDIDDNNDNNDDDNNDSSDSHSSNDSTDGSSNNSTRTPPEENKETIESTKNIKVKAMISATLGQGYTNDRTHIDYQDNAASAFSKQTGTRSKKSRMTTEEACRHTKDSIKARKKAINERTAKKMALTGQTVAAMDTVDASISPSTPKRERTQKRSPGGTPDKEQKLQRTGTAPERPSTDDKIACALDFKSQDKSNLPVDATKGTHGKAMEHK
jgi:hypothetical protein